MGVDYFPNKLGFRSCNSALLPFGSADNTETVCGVGVCGVGVCVCVCGNKRSGFYGRSYLCLYKPLQSDRHFNI